MITLYSNGCPQCKLLKSQLDKNEIPYIISIDFEKLISKGIATLPIMELDNHNLLTLADSLEHIKQRGLI